MTPQRQPPPRLQLSNDDYRSSLLRDAEDRGYLTISGQSIKYFCAREIEQRFADPEERVRAAIFSWLIIAKGYPARQIDLEVPVPRRTPSDRADIVIYSDPARRDPYLVVECKAGRLSARARTQAIEQAFGNANSFRVTKFALLDNIQESLLFAVDGHSPTERDRNRLGPRDSLPPDFGRAPDFRLVAGSSSDIKTSDARDLEHRVRRAHGTIWAGGKRDPLRAFDEWCKLLFAKIHDERTTRNAKPRRFQVGSGESSSRVGTRVRELYGAAIKADPSIFSTPISLPDHKISEVVSIIEDIGFTISDLDTLGVAFEAFFGSVFRGGLGQYFTRREIARFTCAMLQPSEEDVAIDPTAGSGGFLLELLVQVWHRIDRDYAGRPDRNRLRLEFASKRLYGIEIHEVLGRVCQTNLLLHKDGHTNIEVDRTCFDVAFTNPRIRFNHFTIVVGNPPFGDKIKQGDRDKLGGSRLSEFGFGDSEQVDSEIVTIVRAIQFLAPGGKLGMVVPDGILNNTGEQRRAPWLRRHLLTRGRLLAVVSLPDFAFRKAGAQNKTSIIFWQRFTDVEAATFEATLERKAPRGRGQSVEAAEEAIGVALREHNYYVFFAEADRIGFTPSGVGSPDNDLYASEDRIPAAAESSTVFGQYLLFTANPATYRGTSRPACMAVQISEAFAKHPSHRLDPKFHLFQRDMLASAPTGMIRRRLGDLLVRRRDIVIPYEMPDTEFRALTLSQRGYMEFREAGVGNNPPAWFGSYFKPGVRWFYVRTGDLLLSRIDIWKGSVAIVPGEFAGCIVTAEFPMYEILPAEVDAYYLGLLLRTPYMRRAIRAVTTGHSNRRRTQDVDFENLEVVLPGRNAQRRIARLVKTSESKRVRATDDHARMLDEATVMMTGGE